jgi:hypothetical protein
MASFPQIVRQGTLFLYADRRFVDGTEMTAYRDRNEKYRPFSPRTKGVYAPGGE